MINIRQGVFETNSSSSHTITIGDELPKHLKIPERLEVCMIDEGRDFYYNSIEEKFTFIVVLAEQAHRLDDLLKMLTEIGVKEKILTKCDGSSLLWNGCGIGANSLCEIDTGDTVDYVNEILESTDSLKKWLFSPDSYASGEDDNCMMYY